MSDDWDDWLAKAPSVRVHEKLARGAVLDSQLSKILQQEMVTFDALTRPSRRWIHRRCEQLGLVSTSGVNISQKKKNITVKKPKEWTLPNGSVRSFETRSRNKRPKSIPQEPPRVECNGCGEECEGLYHWRGMGPLCTECIEADEEWSAHKWEPLW